MTVAKLRLVMWVLVTGAAAWVLLGDVRWSDEPAIAVMSVVRFTAGVLAAYLCAATVLAIRLPRVAPQFVRRLVAGAVGTGLLVTPMVASAEPRPAPPAEAPVLRRQPAPPTPDLRDVATPKEASTRRQNEEVVVAAGDHLWSIAEQTLTERLGRAPNDAEVTPFWLELIELNTDRVADPDLIFSGQVLRLPS